MATERECMIVLIYRDMQLKKATEISPCHYMLSQTSFRNICYRNILTRFY